MEDTREKKTYLICPVRDVNPLLVWPVVDQLEIEGWDVYWPARDANQDDATGFNILDVHRFHMNDRPFVHLFWLPSSKGSLFDLGMAFAGHKELIVLSQPEPSKPGKSFERMVLDWRCRLDLRRIGWPSWESRFRPSFRLLKLAYLHMELLTTGELPAGIVDPPPWTDGEIALDTVESGVEPNIDDVYTEFCSTMKDWPVPHVVEWQMKRDYAESLLCLVVVVSTYEWNCMDALQLADIPATYMGFPVLISRESKPMKDAEKIREYGSSQQQYVF